MITFSKIEETLLPESREPDPQHDAFSKIEEASFSESIEEALAFSKAGLLRDHEGRYQKSKRHLLF
jgi:hypothetical protein